MATLMRRSLPRLARRGVTSAAAASSPSSVFAHDATLSATRAAPRSNPALPWAATRAFSGKPGGDIEFGRYDGEPSPEAIKKYGHIFPNDSKASKQQMAFVSVEATPNPLTIKFFPNVQVLPDDHEPADFRTRVSARRSPLARDLFDCPGVVGVYLGPDFVSVTKASDDEHRWTTVKPAVFACLMNFFTASEPRPTIMPSLEEEEQEKQQKAKDALAGAAAAGFAPPDDEVVLLIQELLEEKVRPMARDDGGDVLFKGFEPKEGVVSVQLVGSCVGCPSSTATLKNGVENMLRHYIPEVKRVDSIALDETADEDGEGGGGERQLSFKPTDA